MKAAINLPTPHSAQLHVLETRKRRNVLCNGRRWGKNVLLQILAAEMAIQGKFVGWAAPVYRQTLDDYRALIEILQPVTKRANGSEMRIETINGGIVEFWSLDHPDSIRGKRYHRFIVNEAAFVANLLDIRNNIILPTTIDFGGDEWHSGTPKGMNGFATLYQQTGAEWAHWQMSSYSNPHVPASELDSLKTLMPERAFQQEIMAQFLEDGGGVFRGVRGASTLQPADPIQGRQYVIGVDWGRSNDATVFCVMDAGSKQQVALDRMTDTDYASQRTRLVALAGRYNNAHIIAEANSMGQPNIEALQNAGMYVTPFVTTNSTKANIIQALELAFERGDIALLNDELQINELTAYQSEKLPSGLVRYGSPDGLHDDTVMALAMAWSSISADTWLIS
jgi:phage terminase large subunit-like protein